MAMDSIKAATARVVGSLHVDLAKTSGVVQQPQSTNSKSMPNLDPMSRQEATKLVTRLLAGFPNLSSHDPQGYIAALVQVMSEYPLWAGNQAILKVDAEDTQFPPSDRTLRKWLDDAVRPRKF